MVDRKGQNGRELLRSMRVYAAAYRGFRKSDGCYAIRILLEHGVSLDLLDHLDFTPFSCAIQRVHLDLANILVEAGPRAQSLIFKA